MEVIIITLVIIIFIYGFSGPNYMGRGRHKKQASFKEKCLNDNFIINIINLKDIKRLGDIPKENLRRVIANDKIDLTTLTPEIRMFIIDKLLK
jgi:hypothetical protein